MTDLKSTRCRSSMQLSFGPSASIECSYIGVPYPKCKSRSCQRIILSRKRFPFCPLICTFLRLGTLFAPVITKRPWM